jgi:hypothetical protein
MPCVARFDSGEFVASGDASVPRRLTKVVTLSRQLVVDYDK